MWWVLKGHMLLWQVICTASPDFILSSAHAPTKSGPWSEWKRRTKAFTKIEVIEVDRDSTISVCTTLVTKQIKRTAQCFLSAKPPQMHHELIVHGLNMDNINSCEGRTWADLLSWLSLTSFTHRFFLSAFYKWHTWRLAATSSLQSTINQQSIDHLLSDVCLDVPPVQGNAAMIR